MAGSDRNPSSVAAAAAKVVWTSRCSRKTSAFSPFFSIVLRIEKTSFTRADSLTHLVADFGIIGIDIAATVGMQRNRAKRMDHLQHRARRSLAGLSRPDRARIGLACSGGMSTR